MDFLSAFLLVVQLLATYRQLKDGRDTIATDFLAYLERHQHAELKSFVERNAGMLLGIEELLQVNQAQVLDQMSSLNRLSVQILSKLDAFRPLVARAAPGLAIEGEAIELIQGFYGSAAPWLLMVPAHGEDRGRFQFGDTGTSLIYDEPMFMHDDCETLVCLGLLTEEPRHDGWRLFRPTRAGARFAATLTKH